MVRINKATCKTNSVQKIKKITKPVQKLERLSVGMEDLKSLALKKCRPLSDKMNEKFLTYNSRVNQTQFKQIIDPSKYECSICLELILNATLMECGHLYCLKCLEENTVYQLKCCLCRKLQDTAELQPCSFADQIIRKFLLSDTDATLNYLCRLGDFESWEGKRRLNIDKLEEGDLVDFRDSQNIWRRACVKTISIDQNQQKWIEVKMIINNEEVLQKVECTSRRLAQFTFFTKSRYLQERVEPTPNYIEDIEAQELPMFRASMQENINSYMSFDFNLQSVSNNEDVQSPASDNDDARLLLFRFDMAGNQSELLDYFQ